MQLFTTNIFRINSVFTFYRLGKMAGDALLETYICRFFCNFSHEEDGASLA